MDPWLESYWSSIHHRLITSFADQIQDQLPDGLYAEIEVTVYITGEDGDHGNVIPDVGVFGSPPARATHSTGDSYAGVALATPYLLKLPMEPIEEGHVVIRSLKDHSGLITAIEVLSPTNKINRRGRREYLRKREEYHRANANVVEIDLLRGGADLIDVPFEQLPERLITPYKAVVRPAHPTANVDGKYYSFPLREALKAILIPLRRSEPEVVLNLQAAIDEAYIKGRYATRIDYSKPPSPPLSAEDAAWAAGLVSTSA
jgi:hypothetical protein